MLFEGKADRMLPTYSARKQRSRLCPVGGSMEADPSTDAGTVSCISQVSWRTCQQSPARPVTIGM